MPGSERVYLLDTVILIDHLRGIPAATSWLKKHASKAAISVITRAEVLAGTPDQELSLVKALLDSFPCLAMDKDIADLAASLRKAERWKLPDAIQAAFAKHAGLKLVTRNIKDFVPKKGGFVLVPYTVSP